MQFKIWINFRSKLLSYTNKYLFMNKTVKFKQKIMKKGEI